MMGLGTGHGCGSSRTRRCKARRHLLRPRSLRRGQQDKGHVPACGTSSAMAGPGKENSRPSAPPGNTGGVGRGQDTQPARGGGQVGQDPAAALQDRNRRQKGPGMGPRCCSCPSQPRVRGCSYDVPAGGARRDPKSGVWAASTPSPPWLPFPAEGNGDLRAPAQPAVDGMYLPHGYCSTGV